MGDRVLRRTPGSPAIARHAAALALAGRADDAMTLTNHALATLPLAPAEFERVMNRAETANPAALTPLLARVKAAGR
jgi:hypothetical protein